MNTENLTTDELFKALPNNKSIQEQIKESIELENYELAKQLRDKLG